MKLKLKAFKTQSLSWEKYENISQGQKSRSKCQKLQITLSIFVTDILIKPQQFLASSFWVAHYRFFTAVILILEPWPWNGTVT